MTDKIIDTPLIILVTALVICFALSGEYHKQLKAEYHQGYSDGYDEGLHSAPVDQTGAHKHINEQLKRMLDDDRSNPVCEYYTDSEGYGHGCLTDEQLDAIIELDTFVNNEM